MSFDHFWLNFPYTGGLCGYEGLGGGLGGRGREAVTDWIDF